MGGDRADEAQGRDIKRGMLAVVLPPIPSLFELSGPLSEHDLELAVAGEEERPLHQ